MQKNNGQLEGFNEAWGQYSDALFRHCLFRVSNRETALDLVQETFTKTWAQISCGEVIERFQPYLYHVLNNLIIDFYRKKKSVSLDALADDGFDPAGSGADEIIDHAEGSLLMKLLEELPEHDRTVIVMRYIDGLQVTQIARVLKESENSVSVRLHRALKKLKQLNHHNEY